MAQCQPTPHSDVLITSGNPSRLKDNLLHPIKPDAGDAVYPGQDFSIVTDLTTQLPAMRTANTAATCTGCELDAGSGDESFALDLDTKQPWHSDCLGQSIGDRVAHQQ